MSTTGSTSTATAHGADRSAPPHRPAGRRATAPGAVAALTARAVLDRLPLALGLAAAMVAMGLLVAALWAPLQDTFADLQDELPAGFDALLGGVSLATPAGWLNAELLSLVAPAAVIAAALSASRSVAAEEERGTLGVLLAAPVSRTAFLLARLAAAAVTVLVVVAGVWAAMLVADTVGDLGIGFAPTAAVTAHLALTGLFFAALAVAVGALTGAARTTAVAVAAAGVLAFALSTFAPMVDAIAWLRWASPWHYYAAATPLLNGANGWHLLVLGGATLVVTALAVVVYRRRDLRG